MTKKLLFLFLFIISCLLTLILEVTCKSGVLRKGLCYHGLYELLRWDVANNKCPGQIYGSKLAVFEDESTLDFIFEQTDA